MDQNTDKADRKAFKQLSAHRVEIICETYSVKTANRLSVVWLIRFLAAGTRYYDCYFDI